MLWGAMFEHGVNMDESAAVTAAREAEDRAFEIWLGSSQTDEMRAVLVGWRARCLRAERGLSVAMEIVAGLRSDLIAATGSGLGRK